MEHYTFLFRLFDLSKPETQNSISISIIVGSFASFCNDFFGISITLFVFLCLIMVTDFRTGLLASKLEEKNKAKKENRPVGKYYNSKKGLQWVFKLGSYLIFLSLSFNLRKEIISNGMDFLDIPMKLMHYTILIHIFLWETVSVDENFERLGYSFRILKLFRWFLEILQLKTKKQIENEA